MTEEQNKFCGQCSSLIPKASKSCPLCKASSGTSSRLISKNIPKTKIGFQSFIFKKKMRISIFIFSVILSIISMVFGTQAQLPPREVSEIIKWASGFNPTIFNIFLNNAWLFFIISVPILGTTFMTYIGYNTGAFLSAIASTTPIIIDPIGLLVEILFFPWFWLEIISYSLASTQGLMFLIGIFTGRWKEEGKNLLMIIGIGLLLIAVGAVIEYAYIQHIF